MKLTLVCPDCGSRLPVAAADAPDAVACGRCRRTLPLSVGEKLRADAEVDRCPVCEGGDFYVRKDFNPQLGLTVIIVGALVSAAFYWYGMDLIAYGVLGVAALVDLVVYGRLGDLTVCYRCHAEFRGAYRRTAPSSTSTRPTSSSWNGRAGSASGSAPRRARPESARGRYRRTVVLRRRPPASPRLRPTSFTSQATVSTIHREVIGVAYRPTRRPRPTYGQWTPARRASRSYRQPDSARGRWTVGAPSVGSCKVFGESWRRAPLNDAIAHASST